jgi:hypothetical protein
MSFRRRFVSLAPELNRRRFLAGVVGSGMTLAQTSRLFGAEFWNVKDPSTWTEEEIGMLTSKSPWAREAVPNFRNADDPTATSDGRSLRRGAVDAIIVRWESAQPILDALKAPMPADFESHYVLSVTNLPVLPARPKGRGAEATPDDTLERMQSGATLQAKGRDAAEAGFARRSHIGSYLFGFSRDYLRLTPNDREITFVLDITQLMIKAKFDSKTMNYHGKLAV